MNTLLKLISIFIIVFISSVSNAVDKFFSENTFLPDNAPVIGVEHSLNGKNFNDNVLISTFQNQNAEIISGKDNKDGFSLSAVNGFLLDDFLFKSAFYSVNNKLFFYFNNRIASELENSIKTRAP